MLLLNLSLTLDLVKVVRLVGLVSGMYISTKTLFVLYTGNCIPGWLF